MIWSMRQRHWRLQGQLHFSLKINRVLMRRFGEHAVQFLIPLAEEAIKTGSAVLLQFSVVSIHLGFGLCEAGYDLIANPEVGSAKRLGAALLAIAGHGLFGWITWLLMELVGSVFFLLLRPPTWSMYCGTWWSST